MDDQISLMADQQPAEHHVEVFHDAHPTATTSLVSMANADLTALATSTDAQDVLSMSADAVQPANQGEVLIAEVVFHLRYKWSQQSVRLRARHRYDPRP